MWPSHDPLTEEEREEDPKIQGGEQQKEREETWLLIMDRRDHCREREIENDDGDLLTAQFS